MTALVNNFRKITKQLRARGKRNLVIVPLLGVIDPDDLPVFQKHDGVHAHDGRYPMRNGKHCTSPYKFVQALLNDGFRFDIERQHRLVKDEYGRIFQHGPRQRNALPLPAEEPHPAVVNDGIDAANAFRVLKCFDKIKRPTRIATSKISSSEQSRLPRPMLSRTPGSVIGGRPYRLIHHNQTINGIGRIRTQISQ